MMTTDTYVSDYSLFDPKAFLDTFCKEKDEGVLFSLNFFHDVYKSGISDGSTLLDFGSGPSILCVISASQHSTNIYLSDFSKNNRNALCRWLNKDPDTHDFSIFFDYLKNKDAKECITESASEDDLRSKIRGILSCDMNLENPLYPAIFPQFDVINSGFCLETSASKSAYRVAATNVASLVKPGGWVVLVGSLKDSFFSFGNFKFPMVSLSSDEIQQIWRETGFTIEVWKQQGLRENAHYGCKGIFGMACRKA